ncbi:MAG: IS6 family transposase [Halopseudomonas aestusnigri]
MSEFKWRHYHGTVILQCVRWYCKYGISYRDLEEMMCERGVQVDHSTLYRWVQRYAPELEKKIQWYKRSMSYSWRVDEAYIKVKGKWKYLYRAIDKDGDTLDFYLSATRNTKAAKRFLSKNLKRNKHHIPVSITSDKAPTYGEAIRELKAEGKIPNELLHRQIKYLNNRLEGDHGKLKRLIKPTLGFKSMKTAYATIKGFEVMRMFKKGQFRIWMLGETGPIAEARFINRLFGVYA